jgi:hypothetical protein
MEKVQVYQKLKLNKRTISMLQTPAFVRNFNMSDRDCTTEWTVKCTLPECGSVQMGCRTDQMQSCAPCAPPPTRDPNRPGG